MSKYNILMFGTGMTASVVEKVLENEVNIMAYLDNDKGKWGKKRNNTEIVSPDALIEYNYDFIVIASQFNEPIYRQLLLMNVNEDKILQFHKFLDLHNNHVEKNIKAFENLTNNDFEVLCTGISYMFSALRPDILCKKIYKFTFGSQDIFYDYHTIKYILEKAPKKVENVRYVIIGLSYYSFQYDMSLSSLKNKVILYYSILKEEHHFKDVKKVYGEYVVNKNIADKIFRKNKDGSYDFKWDAQTLSDCDNKWELGKKQAEIDCNKEYPETVKENIQLFKNYLELLKKHNLKPIVVVCPASKYYTANFSKRIEEEFHSIIKDAREEYDFQYIDYFRSDLFGDGDFNDLSHLNWYGAEKFTKILNKEIQW